jgi:MoaA/NifB/PqqE/SkfB family radical SAM enzyme
MNLNFSPENMYRLPWNLADNAISWLEPTSQCNLYCDGCYRENRKSSHKSLEDIKHDLEIFKKNRRTDSISVAGGEPLCHPQIVDIVKLISDMGWKPVINSNGGLLNMDLLKDLKKAGCWGFTLHVDSGQQRPGWKGKNEIELNELRSELAEMLASVGNLSCSFNATVYPETLHYIKDLVKWGQDNIDMVHVMVFILYRIAKIGDNYDFYVGDKKVNFDDMTYVSNDENRRSDISSPEAINEIRKIYPDFMPCAFLNGTVKADSYKWLLTGRLGNKHEVFGYVGPKFMEIVQTFKHLFTDSYLAYSTTAMQRRGRSYFPLGIFDKGVRGAMMNYFNSLKTNPIAFFSKVHYQSIMLIQPVDVMPDGSANMCDGCPDITVYGDELVWSCRMEEQYRWGQNVRMVPKT